MINEICSGKEESEDGMGNKLRQYRFYADNGGNTVTRINQEYDGLPVLGSQIIVRENKEREIPVRLTREITTGETTWVARQRKISGEH